MDPRWTPNGPQMDPKWTQNGPKMDPKWTQNGPQMDPKWTPNGPQMDPKMDPKWTQNGPKMDTELDTHTNAFGAWHTHEQGSPTQHSSPSMAMAPQEDELLWRWGRSCRCPESERDPSPRVGGPPCQSAVCRPRGRSQWVGWGKSQVTLQPPDKSEQPCFPTDTLASRRPPPARRLFGGGHESPQGKREVQAAQEQHSEELSNLRLTRGSRCFDHLWNWTWNTLMTLLHWNEKSKQIKTRTSNVSSWAKMAGCPLLCLGSDAAGGTMQTPLHCTPKCNYFSTTLPNSQVSRALFKSSLHRPLAKLSARDINSCFPTDPVLLVDVTTSLAPIQTTSMPSLHVLDQPGVDESVFGRKYRNGLSQNGLSQCQCWNPFLNVSGLPLSHEWVTSISWEWDVSLTSCVMSPRFFRIFNPMSQWPQRSLRMYSRTFEDSIRWQRHGSVLLEAVASLARASSNRARIFGAGVGPSSTWAKWDLGQFLFFWDFEVVCCVLCVVSLCCCVVCCVWCVEPLNPPNP